VKNLSSQIVSFFLPLLLLVAPTTTRAQIAVDSLNHLSAAQLGEEEGLPADSTRVLAKQLSMADSAQVDTTSRRHRRNWATWRPETRRALWLALVIPGAGQIYNRKYWKLPIIYGGFVGCAYAMRWNNMMYHDYSQAYIDIMDDDPLTQSYNQFLHLGTQITSENMSQWQEVFRKRKDRYRRWRDLSFFVLVGVYALSVIDAYVDASLSEFDITPDLSFHWSPALMGTPSQSGRLRANSIGLQCQLTF
jgi:hypothetical protein